jgi:hypothetical protein
MLGESHGLIEALCRHWPGETEENYEKFSQGSR